MVNRGEIWWTDLPEPRGSSLGYRRPVLVIQDDDFNNSPINTVIVASITTNLRIAKAKGNVLFLSRQSGLPKDSVVNVSQLQTIDNSFFLEYVSTISNEKMKQVENGLRLVLSLLNKE